MNCAPHYGAKLRALREQTGLSCRRLAREMGLPESTLIQAESGRAPCEKFLYQRAVRTMQRVTEAAAAAVRDEAGRLAHHSK